MTSMTCRTMTSSPPSAASRRTRSLARSACGDPSTASHMAYAGIAYQPATGAWRRLPSIASLDEGNFEGGSDVVWAGSEAFLAGLINGAYGPAANHWRRLPAMGTGRMWHSTVWTGRRLLVWGGRTFDAGAWTAPATGSPTTRSPTAGRRCPSRRCAADSAMWRCGPGPGCSSGVGIRPGRPTRSGPSPTGPPTRPTRCKATRSGRAGRPTGRSNVPPVGRPSFLPVGPAGEDRDEARRRPRPRPPAPPSG
jgi:hypothetical protein